MWRNNSLSIVIFALFALTLAGHSYAGWKAHNEEERQHGSPEIAYSEFLRSSEFGETVFENWESEFFQMGFYVVLTAFLFQKGSSESKDPDRESEADHDPAKHRKDPKAPLPVRKGGWTLALYKNSLSLAFLALFLFSFVGHAASGARKYSDEQLKHGSGERIRTVEYMGKAQFWYESFQNWQSEFLAVLSIVVLSIWLRQWGSPESKPVHAPHEKTGGG
jgi:hypothetical protein